MGRMAAHDADRNPKYSGGSTPDAIGLVDGFNPFPLVDSNCGVARQAESQANVASSPGSAAIRKLAGDGVLGSQPMT